MKAFVKCLKKKYKMKQLSSRQRWPKSSNKFEKLQLVEANMKSQCNGHSDKFKRTPIFYGDLFKGEKPVNRLIVEGEAGIGKTTLCAMLTEQWANGEILTQFDCVLLLLLREKPVAAVSSLPGLLTLYHSDESVCEFVVKQLNKKGKKLLIIADGWDEVGLEHRTKRSFLYNLLFECLSVSVLLTSRPFASAPFHDLPSVDRVVELVGFDEEIVECYINAEFEQFPEKASSLIEQLENNPVIQSVCSVPLNCAIVCSLWTTSENENALPETLTELYTQLVLEQVFHSVKKDVECQIVLQSLDSIPVDFQETFWLTCEFAYQCLAENRTVFTEGEIVSTFHDQNRLLSFGLVECVQTLVTNDHETSFKFLHLTIQEFLAALHFTALPNKEKQNVCKAYARNNRFERVWRFAFGIGCREDKSSLSKKMVHLNDDLVDQFVGEVATLSNLFLCHCSLESSTAKICIKISHRINGQFESISSNAKTPYDCVAIFCVIRHTRTCQDLRITLNNLNDTLLKELTDILSTSAGALQISHLTLSGNKLTVKGVTDLVSRAPSSLLSLQSILLAGKNIDFIEPFPSKKVKTAGLLLKFLYLSEEFSQVEENQPKTDLVLKDGTATNSECFTSCTQGTFPVKSFHQY